MHQRWLTLILELLALAVLDVDCFPSLQHGRVSFRCVAAGQGHPLGLIAELQSHRVVAAELVMSPLYFCLKGFLGFGAAAYAYERGSDGNVSGSNCATFMQPPHCS